MSYVRTTWGNGQTALSADHLNNIEEGIGEAMQKAQGNSDMWSYIRNLVYPVGSIYMSATLSTKEAVEAALGGTWIAWGSGRVPVGVDTGQTEFNQSEKNGGSKFVQAHTHGFTAPSVTGGATTTGAMNQNASHTHWAAVATTNAAAGSNRNSVYGWNHGGTVLATSEANTDHVHAVPAHTHSVSGGSVNAVSGVSTGNAGNLQPYITCYMWKRTA